MFQLEGTEASHMMENYMSGFFRLGFHFRNGNYVKINGSFQDNLQ